MFCHGRPAAGKRPDVLSAAKRDKPHSGRARYATLASLRDSE
jgi:hypothetical protein